MQRPTQDPWEWGSQFAIVLISDLQEGLYMSGYYQFEQTIVDGKRLPHNLFQIIQSMENSLEN